MARYGQRRSGGLFSEVEGSSALRANAEKREERLRMAKKAQEAATDPDFRNRPEIARGRKRAAAFRQEYNYERRYGRNR